MKDPLKKIEEKFKDKNLRFSLKKVTVATVKKSMKQMSKKKSKGNDGIIQDCLLMGLETDNSTCTKENKDSFIHSLSVQRNCDSVGISGVMAYQQNQKC